MIPNALHHFRQFHQGRVNQFLHVLGFALLSWALAAQAFAWFLVGLVVVESGHLFNHFTGHTRYDTRWHVVLTRIAAFALVMILAYFAVQTLLIQSQ